MRISTLEALTEYLYPITQTNIKIIENSDIDGLDTMHITITVGNQKEPLILQLKEAFSRQGYLYQVQNQLSDIAETLLEASKTKLEDIPLALSQTNLPLPELLKNILKERLKENHG
jgi:hypothetical protein